MRTLLSFVFLSLLCAISLAQDGVSTTGEARAKYLGKLGIIPASREVVVEDFVNYHRHEIGRPTAGEAVALDLRWEKVSVGSGGDAILQVGLSTALAHDRHELRPLNLSLVIDKSGSMADANKLSRVKEAVSTLVQGLRPTDTLSIVVFDSDARVVLPSEPVEDPAHIQQIVREIEPGSATNLNAGLMLGYREAVKHFRTEATNRVILLTDGIANRGITDPKEIAEASSSFNDRGIDLSTIGVGMDVNKDLLRELAKSGRGLSHFIGDTDDIKKVFVDELQSLISPVATEPDLHLSFGSGLELKKVYGYEPKVDGRSVGIKLDTMNSGMTEVVLMRFRVRGEQSRLPVKATLDYYDIERGKPVELTESAALASDSETAASEDGSVAKNYAIAQLAQSIHDMAADCEAQRYREAEGKLRSSISETLERYPDQSDPDIKRTLAIAQRYEQVLAQQVGEPAGENLIPNGDFSRGNTGFSSGVDYIAPCLDCLWGCNYTIAPSFNEPQLHHLVQPEPFSAPVRRTGNEQVYFANLGGPNSEVAWSSVVKCRPHTRYRISFYCISLSGHFEGNSGAETPDMNWVSTFSIKVGDRVSTPQAAGCGVYAKISMTWDSTTTTSTPISIIRNEIPHGGGLIGIANIEMTPENDTPLD